MLCMFGRARTRACLCMGGVYRCRSEGGQPTQMGVWSSRVLAQSRMGFRFLAVVCITCLTSAYFGRGGMGRCRRIHGEMAVTEAQVRRVAAIMADGGGPFGSGVIG